MTGALGNIGRLVAEALLQAGAEVRAADRDAGRVVAEWSDWVEAASLEFTKPETWDATFADELTRL